MTKEHLEAYVNYRIDDILDPSTPQDSQTFHHRRGFYIDKKTASGGHFTEQPFAWYNILPYTTGNKRNVLLHEFQSDAIEQVRMRRKAGSFSEGVVSQEIDNALTKSDAILIALTQTDSYDSFLKQLENFLKV